MTKEGSGELLITRFVLHADSIAANSAKSVTETITFFYIVLKLPAYLAYTKEYSIILCMQCGQLVYTARGNTYVNVHTCG